MRVIYQHQKRLSRNTILKKYDHIQLQLSVQLMSYFFVRKESIATTFTQKYACEENDQKSVLGFCVRKENYQSLIIHI